MEPLKDWNRELKASRQRLAELRERAQTLRDQDQARSASVDRTAAIGEQLEALAGQRETVKAGLLDAIVEGDAGAERSARAELRKVSDQADTLRAELDQLEAPEVDQAERADVAAQLATFAGPDAAEVLEAVEELLTDQLEELRSEVLELRRGLPAGTDSELYSAALERHDPRYKAEMDRIRATYGAERERREREHARNLALLEAPQPERPSVRLETPEREDHTGSGYTGPSAEDIYAAIIPE